MRPKMIVVTQHAFDILLGAREGLHADCLTDSSLASVIGGKRQ